MRNIDPETPDAMVADVLAQTASLVAGKYGRLAMKAPTPEAKEAAKAKMADAWDSAYQNLGRDGMIAEIQRLRSLLDELEGAPDDR
ncbi:hypothetical protein J0910_31110 [Nocardiopsis sp. CNT-189]|uniref:hypothetical protein n=1 Tax=Nocardiopsis oceanisediminis TaxID=2816862 RepID=UPI003B315BDD